MTADDILAEMQAQIAHPNRRNRRVFAGGLLPAFCRFFLSLDHPPQGYASWQHFIERYPLVTEGANTLTVSVGGKTKTIRPHYEKVANFYVVENDRPDFPSAAPHATGQWRDYQHWLEALVCFTPAKLQELEARACHYTLEHLPEEKFDAAEISHEPRRFEALIEHFDLSAKTAGEKTGAAFQALVFGYIRANAPHLQVEARKVRTGSARAGGVGDIDAWEGRRLISTAEVKHFRFGKTHIDDIAQFLRKAAKRRAHRMVVALEFDDAAVDILRAAGAHPLTKHAMLLEVQNWDPRKQTAAVMAFEYAIARIEKSAGLVQRFDAFMANLDDAHRPGA